MTCPRCHAIMSNIDMIHFHNCQSQPNISLENWVSRKGWECPKCGRCYAPGYPSCDFCGKTTPLNQTTVISGGPDSENTPSSP